MGQTKYINSESFTATNTFRSAATITVLVLCLSAAYGENPTNNVVTRSAVDLFLFQNKDTDLLECDSVAVETNNVRKSWQICVQGVQVSLTAYERNNDTRKEESHFLHFQIGQEVMIKQVFEKYLEWDTIATKNKAQPFDKLIANYRDLTSSSDEIQSFTFHWLFDISALWDSAQGMFYRDDVAHFQELLKRLPNLKAKLADKIRGKETQQGLFK